MKAIRPHPGRRDPATGGGFGPLLREWRRRRRYTQLALALETGTSSRHLSFLETGRARPSRDMVHRLAEHLDIPLRERNGLLLAAGYAPDYRDLPLRDASMASVREAIDSVLSGFEPFPALAVDRRWTVLAANSSVRLLLDGVAPHLLEPPMNALRVSLHPDGIASRIVNLPEWRRFVLRRLHGEAMHSGDAEVAALLNELRAYPVEAADTPGVRNDTDAGRDVAVPLVIRTPRGLLSFISTTTVFGTATDVTLAELAIECFLPANAGTRAVLQELAASAG